MPAKPTFLEALELYEKVFLHPQLRGYKRPPAELEQLRHFLMHDPEPTRRENFRGHLTATASILSRDRKRLLLIFHEKVNLWIPVGGHVEEDDAAPSTTALREAIEETGLEELSFFRWEKPFYTEATLPVPHHIDIHAIPATQKEPSHTHYNFCYLLQCEEEEEPLKSDEILNWEKLEELPAHLRERDLLWKLRPYLI